MAAAALLAASCRDTPPAPERQPLLNAADSVAARIAEAAGADAFESLPALRWDFAVVRDSVETSRNRHLWDRAAGRHRLEWMTGDSSLVALFSTREMSAGVPADGAVFYQGQRLDTTEAAELLETAYSRFINDMYWLLAPLKLFDPGVHRGIARQSSDERAVLLTIRFEGVGLTPGDRYWIHSDSATGRMTRWDYHLESGRQGSHAWTSERTIRTPAGPITLPTRKSSLDSGTVILTPFEAGVLDSTFSSPRAQLEPLQ